MTLQKKCTYQLLFKRTKVALLFFIILCASAHANAQEFRSTSAYQLSQQKQQAVQTNQTASYNAYEPTVYEPFSSATPSSGSDNGNGPAKVNGRKNAGNFGHVDDPYKDPEPPIGEPWIMLAFATIGAGVIFIKQRKKIKAKA